MMKNCRECNKEVSINAPICPNCGAPKPARAYFDGWGVEYKSEKELFGLPIFHLSFKFRPNLVPVPAVGIISIGQFGMGIINISQFGIGVFGINQFGIMVAGLAQFGIGHTLIAQLGGYFSYGVGQKMYDLGKLFFELIF